MLAIPVVGGLKQEDHELKTILDYTMRLWLRKKTQINKSMRIENEQKH